MEKKRVLPWYLVPENNVVNTRTGYLMFFNRQQYFFPVKKQVKGNDFFTTPAANSGYLVSVDREEQLLMEIGEKYVIDYASVYQGQSVFIRDTVIITPVTIRSLPYKLKGRTGHTTLTFKYSNKLKTVKYYNSNNEGVWSVFPALKEDQEEAAHYHH